MKLCLRVVFHPSDQRTIDMPFNKRQPRGLYRRWLGMTERCRNKNHMSFHNYGGRGIKVCDEWLVFMVFREWAIANGWKRELEIDRVDGDGDYCPENCCFVTPKENRQKRSNVKLSPEDVAVIKQRLAAGETGTKLGKEFGVCSQQISRIKNNRRWGDGPR
jgi:hypothetical protein